MLEWLSEDRFAIGETTFRTIDVFDPPRDGPSRGDLLIAKGRRGVEQYAALIAALRPRYIFELGVWKGGSTALLAELARPRRLVAVDRRRSSSRALLDWIERRRLEDVVRVHGQVDQADTARLGEILAEDLGDQPLDLVLDDCSHRYGPTRDSFNVLFPRVRPGGVYVIEDWPWAHAPTGAQAAPELYPDEVPLTRLIFELVLALPSIPGLIEAISVERDFVLLRRGEMQLEPGEFDVSACSTPRGRELLAPPP
jgi:predicted O-methyltransferase YrrM